MFLHQEEHPQINIHDTSSLDDKQFLFVLLKNNILIVET